MTAHLAARGEPWKSFFESESLATMVKRLGFTASRIWTPEVLNEMYLSNRADGLHIGAGPGAPDARLRLGARDATAHSCCFAVH